MTLEELKDKAIQLAAMLKVLVNSGERPVEDLLQEERKGVYATFGSKDALEGMISLLKKSTHLFDQS